MKCVIILSALVGSMAVQSDQSFYETENDYVDIDSVIEDPTSFQAYVDCFLDRLPCTSLTQSFKDIIQDSVYTQCARCNEPQKHRYSRFIRALRSTLPEDYQSFREKYDPDNIYFDALEAELAKFGNTPLEHQQTS